MSPEGIPPGLPGWKCPRRVGFLFAHDCHRMTPVDCPDCQNGQIDDPFGERRDRHGYTRYDSYDDGYYMGYGRHSWSSSSSSDTVSEASSVDSSFDSGFDSTGDDFTEADGGDLVQTDDSSDDSSDGGFESDSSES